MQTILWFLRLLLSIPIITVDLFNYQSWRVIDGFSYKK